MIDGSSPLSIVAAGSENRDMPCFPILDEDGNVVGSYRGLPMDKAGQKALLALVRAVIRDHEGQDPDGAVAARQEAAIARVRERSRRLRGEPD